MIEKLNTAVICKEVAFVSILELYLLISMGLLYYIIPLKQVKGALYFKALALLSGNKHIVPIGSNVFTQPGCATNR